MQQKPPDAFIVTVIKEPVHEMTVGDLIIGSLGLVGAALVVALALGALVGALLVLWKRLRPGNWRPMPPVTPSLSNADGRPTTPVR